MKIIKANTGEGWTKKITCSNCESVLEIVAKDIRLQGVATPYGYVMCPVCDSKNTISLDDLPPAVKSKMISAYHYIY
jgi:RNase P subunit RPR2